MPTTLQYMQFSLGVYAASVKNFVDPPAGWTRTNWQPDMISGFSAGTFVSGSEVVISFTGTNNFPADQANWLIGAGLPLPQIFDAIDYYFSVKAAYPNANITFTGHSLGAGLASLLAVYFNKQATVFDEAPFQLAALNPVVTDAVAVWMLTKGYSDSAFSDYIFSAGTLALSREVNVTHSYVEGEALEYVRLLAPNLVGSEYVFSTGNTNATSVQLHSMALMTAMQASNVFRDVVGKLPDLVSLMANNNLFATEITDETKEDFKSRMLRHQFGVEGAVTPDNMLERFASDMTKLAQPGGLTIKDGSGPYLNAMNDVSKALSAFAMQMYYEGVNATDANKQLFTTGNGFVAFDIQDVAPTLTQAKGYELFFKSYLYNGLVFTTEERNLIEPALANMRDWYVQSGTVGINATAAMNSAFMLGGSGSDTLTGSSQADVLVGNASGDVLYGMTGNDILIGGAGSDYLDGGAGDDTLNGGTGNDLLMGGTGHNILAGGAGDDVYYLTTGNGNTNQIVETREADGKIHGSLFINNTYSGSLSSSTGLWVKDPARTNTWVSTADTHMILTHNSPWRIVLDDGSEIQLGEFVDGDYGIQLAEYTTPDAPSTTRTIQGDLAPKDQDDNLAGIQTGYDELGNLITDPGTPTPDRADTLYGSADGDHIIGGGGNDTLRDERGGSDRLDGEEGNDSLSAGDGNDQLVGGAGNDSLDGGAGDDLLYANAIINLNTAIIQNATQAGSGLGGESLSGGDGSDVLIGDASNDNLAGGNGNDILVAGGGDDTLWGDIADQPDIGGNDVLYGQAGYDTLIGGAGDDVLDGGNNNDTLYGGAGADMLLGGNGDDYLYGGEDDDVIEGGAGDDYLYGNEGNDSLYGGDGNDSLYAQEINPPATLTERGDLLDGGNGDDYLMGNDDANGSDTLYGGDGKDILLALGGNDILEGGNGDDHMAGGAGNDYLDGGTGNDFVSGDEGQDTIYGGDGDDFLDGGVSDDFIEGGVGNDYLMGRVGINIMNGGLGDDTYFVESADDTVTESLDEGNDRVYSWVSFILSNYVEKLVLQGTADINGTGNNQDNTLAGNRANNILDGGVGNDTILGWIGNDVLMGGEGDDQYWFDVNDGTDQIVETSGNDRIVFDTGIIASQITASRSNGEITLTINSGDSIRFADLGSNTYAVEQFEFADGSIKDAAWVTALLNTSPDGTDKIITINEDAVHTLNATDFGFTDANFEDSLSAVRIGSLPTAGSLTLNSLAVTAGQEIAFTDIANLAFTPAANANGTNYAGFTFSVKDQYGAFDTTPNKLSFNVTAVNDEPVLTDSQATLANGTEDTAYTVTLTQLLQGYTDADGDTLSITGLSANQGTVTDNQDGTYTISPTAQYTGTVTLSYTVTDGNSGNTSGTLGFNLNAPAIITYTGDAADNELTGSAGNDVLNGLGGNDTLIGGSGNDTLDGGAGIDRMEGGSGNDIYMVDNAGDTVIEDIDGGIDTVQVNVVVQTWQPSNTVYTLGANVENGIIVAPAEPPQIIVTATGSTTTAGSLYGNALNNTLHGAAMLSNYLYGNAGNDSLYGGNRQDMLVGGDGDDYIDGGAGSDNISYHTASAGVTVNLSITDAQNTLGGGIDTLLNVENILGSSYNDTLTGNAANNRFQSMGGDDVIDGGDGAFDLIEFTNVFAAVNVNMSDWTIQSTNMQRIGTLTLSNIEGVSGSIYNDTLTGTSGADYLNGYAGSDVIDGGAGDDYLAGGSSADTLTGGEGKDTFILGSDRGLGIQNGVDTITDFNLTDDSFRLISADFTAFIGVTGALTSNNFVTGADKTTATDADDYIIYNSTNGNVFYDPDGSGSSYSSVLIADVTDGLELTYSHFTVSDSVFIV